MWGRRHKVAVSAGARAPSFELKELDGGSKSLDEILKNGPAVLVFFKISCPVCQLTVPYLQRLSGSPTIQVIGISQDDDESTRSFNHRCGVTFPTLLDQSKDDYPASNAYGISSVPSLFLVEPDGIVAKALNGFSKRDLEALGERAGTPVFRPGDSVPEWKAG